MKAKGLKRQFSLLLQILIKIRYALKKQKIVLLISRQHSSTYDNDEKQWTTCF
jgi:hypothetical protein